MSELDQLRQEAEQLKNQIRVRSRDVLSLPITSLAARCAWRWGDELHGDPRAQG